MVGMDDGGEGWWCSWMVMMGDGWGDVNDDGMGGRGDG